MKIVDQLPPDAYVEGKQCTFYGQLPYANTDHRFYAWNNGFVDGCIERKSLPDDAPMHVRGRYDFAMGAEFTRPPAGQGVNGKWSHGWLHQKSRGST